MIKIGFKQLSLFAAALILPVVIALLIASVYSERRQYLIKRIVAKTGKLFAGLRGQPPGTVSLSGRLRDGDAVTESLIGAEITAIESNSGYNVASDDQGNFILPHLNWYPGASYTLVVSLDPYQASRFIIKAPPVYPASGIIEIGELQLASGQPIAASARPTRYLSFERENYRYYRELFLSLTENVETDHERIDRISKYVATRHNPKEDPWSFRTARAIIERGAPHCSNLAFAMAAITAAGGYPTRTVHTSDTADYAHTHVVVEVFYADGWHLYDPTYGVFFLNANREVAGYRELRLTPELIDAEAFSAQPRDTREFILSWMPGLYRSGIHQLYQADELSFQNNLLSAR